MKTIHTLKIKFILIMIVAVFSTSFVFTTFNFNTQLNYMTGVISSYYEFIEDFLNNKKKILSKNNFVQYSHMSLMSRLALLSMKDDGFDKETIKQVMRIFLKQNGLLAFEAFDENKNQILSAYKQNEEIIFGDIPNFILLDSNTEYVVRDLDESKKYNTGTVHVYFNIDNVAKRTDDLLSELLKKFQVLKDSFKDRENGIKTGHQAVVVFYIFMIIGTIYTVIQLLVNKPIRKIRHSLEVFFTAFRARNKSIETINIDTKDEFKDMANMLNDNMHNVLSLHSKVQETQNTLRDSIIYASTIQASIVAKKQSLDGFFIDNFVYWQPRDIVGGDIYFCDILNEDECLLICIDCEGHGVLGAFMTILTKSIYHNIMQDIKNNITPYKEKISLSYMMGYFHKSIREILNQKDGESAINIGFNGGIVHINKKTKEIKYAGAKNSLLIIDEEGKSQVIEGDTCSMGYHKCGKEYAYQESVIKVKSNTKIYLSTDGYINQMGGDKGLRFGMSRFKNMIDDNHNEDFEKQKNIYIESLNKYAGDKDINDDITLIGVLI